MTDAPEETPDGGAGSTPVGGAAGIPPLPEPVRARVVALAAEGLGKLAPEHLPAALKRVASFAPARRAKLAGTQIATVLDSDEQFRERLATQVRALTGELGQALVDGVVPAAADPVDLAATAYLLRPPGWEQLVSAAGDALRSEPPAPAVKQAEQLERVRRKASDLQAELEAQRVKHKEQLEKVKAENADLRRKLGETRVRLRDAEAAAEATRAQGEELAAASGQAVAAAEAEVRRLRTRITELEAEVSSARRAGRADKVSGTVRAKLLVETLVHAAQGLQRELGLPALDRLPGDTVRAHEGEEGSRTSSGRGSLPVDDPALIEELLRLPRAHLVVDGYNVTKNAWPDTPLERQRDRLLTGAAALMARTGAEITVVFDAAETRTRPLVPAPRGLRVLFSPYGVIADDVIRDLVAAEPPGRGLVVATSDQAVARDVVGAGFRVVSASALAGLITRA